MGIVEEEIGALPPLGVWDPQGFIEREPEKFARRRAVERKHGRIAMVAVVGLLTTNAGLTWPGYISKTFTLNSPTSDLASTASSTFPLLASLRSSSSLVSSKPSTSMASTTPATTAPATSENSSLLTRRRRS